VSLQETEQARVSEDFTN
jgi:hypothetical protein